MRGSVGRHRIVPEVSGRSGRTVSARVAIMQLNNLTICGTYHQGLQSSFGIFLLAEFGVNVASQMVRKIFTHTQLLELATDIGELLKDVLVELFKVLLEHVLVLRYRLPCLRIENLRRRYILTRARQKMVSKQASVILLLDLSAQGQASLCTGSWLSTPCSAGG